MYRRRWRRQQTVLHSHMGKTDYYKRIVFQCIDCTSLQIYVDMLNRRIPFSATKTKSNTFRSLHTFMSFDEIEHIANKKIGHNQIKYAITYYIKTCVSFVPYCSLSLSHTLYYSLFPSRACVYVLAYFFYCVSVRVRIAFFSLC